MRDRRGGSWDLMPFLRPSKPSMCIEQALAFSGQPWAGLGWAGLEVGR